ncbi:MAG: bifunctional N(6)-L-threonylcarbamoyladenine synthase/serine/threonine protein kinase [Thermoplasmata archaeon]|nr:bifunctional N(6)-L-threonylcarbamoyladenine synthase/serine/threonine protein kinase [Thermoplasmata archaeon]
MYCLGIEGTAHTISIGLTEGTRPLVTASKMYSPKEGGIHPREAADHHSIHVASLVEEALEKAGMSRKDIGLVAFSQGPGLGPCLRVAATAARALSISIGCPIMGVNHCVAHLEAGALTTDAEDPVLLYASGGNTQVIAFSNGRFRVFGETIDIGIGNMLDKFGRELGMPFPAGPVLEKAAASSDEYIPLPYSVKGMDVSFSGILTAARVLHERGASVEALANSIQETTFAMLVEVTERAMAHIGKEEVLLGGGVARNKRLQEMLEIMARERGARCFVPPPELLVDNGTMIAMTGVLMYDSGLRMKMEETVVNQRFRTDGVEVTWR